MSGILAVIAREMRMRSLVLLAGLLSGLVVLLAGAAVDGSGFLSRAGEPTLILAFVFLAVAGGALGVTSVGRDLAGARSIFLLSRPVAASSIYFGKLASAILLALVSTLLFLAPALLFGNVELLDHEYVVIAVVLAITIVPICAALEVLAKANAAHLILWAVLSSGIVWLAWKTSEPFRLAYSNGIVFSHLLLSLVVVVLGTLVAHAIAFIRERYEVQRQARRFSILYTAMVALVALVLAGSSWALLHMPIWSLQRFVVLDTSPDASSVVVAGNLRDSQLGATYAIDLSDGHVMRLPPSANRGSLLSDEGVFWSARSSRGPEIRSAELAGASPDRPRIIPAGRGRLAAVSEDGRHLAWVSGTVTELLDADGRTIMTIPAIDATSPVAVRPSFITPSEIRLHEWNGSQWRVRKVELSNRSIEPVGAFEGTLALLTSGALRPLVRVERKGRPVEFHEIDPATANVTLRIPSPASVPVPLHDGGWAFADATGAAAIIDSKGNITTRRLPVTGKLRMGSELRPGILMMYTSEDADGAPVHHTSTLYIVDFASGRILRILPGTMPAARLFRSYPPPGSPASRLIENDEGLQLIDPQTLELRSAIRK